MSAPSQTGKGNEPFPRSDTCPGSSNFLDMHPTELRSYFLNDCVSAVWFLDYPRQRRPGFWGLIPPRWAAGKGGAGGHRGNQCRFWRSFLMTQDPLELSSILCGYSIQHGGWPILSTSIWQAKNYEARPQCASQCPSSAFYVHLAGRCLNLLRFDRSAAPHGCVYCRRRLPITIRLARPASPYIQSLVQGRS